METSCSIQSQDEPLELHTKQRYLPNFIASRITLGNRPGSIRMKRRNKVSSKIYTISTEN